MNADAEAIDVAIIGAGTAGLAARSEVAKVTDSYRVFDPGPYGTTCARNACMPSKAFLQSAHDFHRRKAFEDLGIIGEDGLQADFTRVLAETRRIRDGLVGGVLESMEDWRETHLVPQMAAFDAEGVLRAGGRGFRPRATVVASGSRPVVPAAWRDAFGDRILTTERFFELDELPRRVAVVGLGPVGLELGQAMARLGVEVTGFDPSPAIGGLTDEDLQSRLREAVGNEMTIVQAEAEPTSGPDGAIRMRWADGEVEVDCLLAAMGRAPNLDGLGLEAVGIDLGDTGRPDLPDGHLNPAGTRIYFAGDAGVGPALLHEAADEGRVAGHFAARDEDARFRRRVRLRIVFCDPQIALAGATREELADHPREVVVGEAAFDRAGRIQLQREGGGIVRIYAEKATARLLGAAILAPGAEHLAHVIAYAIEGRNDLRDLLKSPAYHPTHEEVLRRALRRALRKCAVEADELDLIRCSDTPVDCDSRVVEQAG